MSETGSIKFIAERSAATIGPFVGLEDLNTYRTKIRQLGLLGVDEKGIGFGNISVRDGTSARFYITGSGSGRKTELMLTDCARVMAYDLARNWVRFEGGAMPSSESLTHAAIYAAEQTVGAVIHFHSSNLWNAILAEAPTTPEDVEYGTPGMARAVQHLFAETNVREKKAFAMAGHREGVIAFGHNLAESYEALIRGTDADR